ncbi:hypothetical protein [Paraburkholderia phenazinium]|uniref:Uncharacterized protein n=1 Tax=Paraburkholderia phenazinium TaxID=60549 RepID=A0A1G7W1R4_9BURK|nr:hypothetical protein [Paraburkholderia phenazinium]SDG65851.1 hypothetical protein SAMN05216466_104357 [Paraburkholderia phenazinium]
MLVNEFRRLAAWLAHPFRQTPVDGAAQSAPSAFDFDPMWHGDHWQNLLSSPMDARHYVMEDWSVTSEVDFAPTGLVAQIR